MRISCSGAVGGFIKTTSCKMKAYRFRYLYEREMYIIARRMVEQAISIFQDTTTLAYARAIDLAGLLDLDLAEPARALVPFKRALEIRKALLGPEDPFIAYSLNNIALAYTEMGDLELAYAAPEEAINLRLDAKSDRIGNSYSNMSSFLLRLGRPDEAEEMLARCPSLKDFTDETFLSTGNPRFSGDMVLLSRIRRAQGRQSEALRLASKALALRQSSWATVSRLVTPSTMSPRCFSTMGIRAQPCK